MHSNDDDRRGPAVPASLDVTAADSRAEHHWAFPIEPDHMIGEFRILRELGRGGNGVVYEALQTSLQRRVALKLLPPGFGTTREVLDRFEREARAAAGLHHIGIVPIFSVGRDNGCHYYTMELIEGHSLAQGLQNVRSTGFDSALNAALARSTYCRQSTTTGFPPETPISGHSGSRLAPGCRTWFDTIARITAEIADALDHAHRVGIIHRDIKPANLMLSRTGHPSITDFGLARILAEPGQTASGVMLGTPAYMSPESIGLGIRPVDHRTDVYSLGTVLYELLTLRPAFSGHSVEDILLRIVSTSPTPPRTLEPRVPKDLETICLKAMDKDPTFRYASAALMAADLRAYLSGELVSARRVGVVRRCTSWSRRHPAAMITAVGALLLTSTSVVAWNFRNRAVREEAGNQVSEARIDLLSGAYREGLQHVDRAIELDPALARARLVRAQLLLDLGRPREATAEARELLRLAPDDWTGHWILAIAAEPDVATAEHLRALEQAAPHNSETYLARAQSAGSSRERLALLDRALELEAGNADALRARIVTRTALRQFPEALLDCDRLISARSASPVGHRSKASVYSMMRQYDSAYAEIEAALGLSPADVATLLERARIHITLYRFRDALADLSRASVIDPQNGEILAELAYTHYLHADYDTAIRVARQSLAANPERVSPYWTAAMSYRALGQLDGFRSMRKELEERLSGWTDSKARYAGYFNLSQIFAANGETEAALRYADLAIQADPRRTTGYAFRVDTLLRSGQRNAAAQTCRALDALNLDTPETLTARGRLFVTCGMLDEALRDFTRVIAMAPSWADAWVNRGDFLRRVAQPEAAASDLDSAVSLAPQYTHALYNRALNNAALHRWSAVLDDLQRVFALGAEGVNGRWLQAVSLAHLQREEEALASLEKSLTTFPMSLAPAADRATLLFYLGRTDEASAAADRLRPRLPRDYRALWNDDGGWHGHALLARISSYSEGGCDRAFEALERSRATETNEDLVDYTEAWVLCSSLALRCPGRVDLSRALTLARRAVESEPRNVDYQRALGLALFRVGRYSQARAALEVALRLRHGMPPSVDVEDSIALAVPENVRHHDGLPSLYFTLAMTDWMLGRHGVAREEYALGVEGMEMDWPLSPENIAFRDEARKLLGIRD